jgi:DNA-binding protein Fis
MNKKELILNEIEKVPEPLLEEILDFVRFLKTKAAVERMEAAVASESSLKKDWLKPEEGEAWLDL